MAKAKYDVGDILTWCNDGDCYATAVIVKCEVYRDYVDGTVDTKYDVFYKNGHYDAFELIRRMPDHAFKNYKLVGHIDISEMSIEAIRTELIYAIATIWNENRIAYAVQNRWALMKHREHKKIYIPEMTDEYCCYNVADKLKEENERLKRENERLKEEFGSANNKISGLKREIDSLRNSYNDTEARISRNLHNLGFTSEAVYKIMYSD